MWYVIGLIWIVAMAGIIMSYNRKQRRRSAERAGQMAALLADLKANPRAVLDAIEKPAAPVASPAAPEFRKKQRLLPQSIALLYYVFRAGLPDHEIFSGLALGDVVDVAAPNGTQPDLLLRKLAQQRLDLVVCTKQLEVVAAVIAQDSAQNVQFATQCLQAAGIRVVSIDPAAPPRHHQVHALIYS